MGRWPIGAQMRRSSRLQPDPMFVGEVGGPHFDLRVGKRRGETPWPPLARAVLAFFEGLLLCGIGQGVLRPRHLQAVFEALQVVPAALGRHRAA